LGRQSGRLGARQTRFRLRDVGARHFADGEPIARLAQLLLQHFDVVAIETENRRIAQNVHIEGDAIQKDVLLRVAQRLAGAHDARFGLANRVERALSIPERLIDG
jgi:hypothetical protein